MKWFLILSLLVLPLTACKEEGAKGRNNALTIVKSDGTEASFDVELAVTPYELQQGLMNRTELAENAGMLFWLGEPERDVGFWMKNTLIPLDIVFIRADGTIRHIHDNAIPLDQTSIPSQGPVTAVLELNGGTAKRLGIQPGDKVKHPFFR